MKSRAEVAKGEMERREDEERKTTGEVTLDAK